MTAARGQALLLTLFGQNALKQAGFPVFGKDH
jgi:hypothetical protein